MEKTKIIHVPKAQEMLVYMEMYIPTTKVQAESLLRKISSNLEMLTLLTCTQGTAPDEWDNIAKHIYTDLNEFINLIQNSCLVTNAIPKNELYRVNLYLDEMKAFGKRFKPEQK
ncbi:MAG: hypothetical protein K0S53_665 [Bacteroidetes bacterium]|jgi:hypothetical protein|nr:hypothetical protein [Bacteroidota bacterium]